MGFIHTIRINIKILKTKAYVIIFSVILGLGALGVVIPLAANAEVNCIETGFYRDGIDMTAVDVNPTTTVTGNINAAGCNIGIYYGPGENGNVYKATVYGSNYYGIVVQKANVDVTNSNVYDIGETPLNGDQHGVGIYYATIDGITNGDCTNGTTSGKVENNSVSTYQKSGIVVDCTGSNVEVDNNIIQGQGPVNYIAQNGIEIGDGANASVTNNIVTGNSYTGANGASSGGILIYGGPAYGGNYTTNVKIKNNTVIGNDVGIYASNILSCGVSSCLPATTKTNIDIESNIIANAGINNTTGNSTTQGYQAGVSDQGDGDTIVNNNITGAGYDPANSSASIAIFKIDITATNNVKLHIRNFR